jgi:hypothetical protein
MGKMVILYKARIYPQGASRPGTAHKALDRVA